MPFSHCLLMAIMCKHVILKARCTQCIATPPGRATVITHTHPFNGPLSRTTQVSRYQKGKTNLDFTEARDSEWHQLGHMQVCTSFQTDNHASTPPPSFFQAGCPSCCPANSIKALKMLVPKRFSALSHFPISINTLTAKGDKVTWWHIKQKLAKHMDNGH